MLKEIQNALVNVGSGNVTLKAMLLPGLQVELVGLTGADERVQEVDSVLHVHVVIRRSMDNQQLGLEVRGGLQR